MEKRVFGVGTLPQAPFFMEKRVFGVGTLPQAPKNLGLNRSAPLLNVRVFFCFNSEFYDREQNTIFLLLLSRPQAPF